MDKGIEENFPKRNFIGFILLFLKGMAMGAADIVPGVSGGTVAFISGIYDELVTSLKNGPKSLLVLVKEGPVAFWHQSNMAFFMVLGSGLVTSLILFASLIHTLLDTHPIQIWSLFFGLIIASVIYIWLQVPNKFALTSWLTVLLGALLGFGATLLPAMPLEPSLIMFFFAGAFAICAMILPGISGAFILLLLGMYIPVTAALKGFDLPIIVVFALGCGCGLLAFSQLLSWLFHTYRQTTLLLMTGFLIGSLNKIWPWQISNLSPEGIPIPRNVLPSDYALALGQSASLSSALAGMLFGIVLLLGFEFLGSYLKKTS